MVSRFAKLLMIIEFVFKFMSPWGIHFQSGEGPSRGLLRDYTTSNFAKVRLKLYYRGVESCAMCGASFRQQPGVCTMYCDCYVTAGAEAEAGNTAPRVPWSYLSPRFTGD